MEYVFEDKQGCILDRILQRSYDKDVYKHIHFKGNNGNAMNFAISEVEKGKYVVIYLDMVPGNFNIQQIYRQLKVTSELHENRLFVVPIYGSEYLIIKAFKDLNIFKDKGAVNLCLEKTNYLDSELYTSDKTKKDYLTFERYCKLVLERNTIDCACTSSRVLSSGYGYTKNAVKNYFYENNCKYKLNGEILELKDKDKRVLKCFDILPKGNLLVELQSCNWFEGWQYHLAAIDELNKFVEAVKHRSELQRYCEVFEPIALIEDRDSIKSV